MCMSVLNIYIYNTILHSLSMAMALLKILKTICLVHLFSKTPPEIRTNTHSIYV